MAQGEVTYRWISRIRDADREAWNALSDRYGTPLLGWDWLNVLEESGSVSPQTGWLPQHLLRFEGERLVAAAPLYVKVHSAGEFVFDYAWAEVAAELEIPYYPKLVAMSPLTPAVGYRFLIDPACDQAALVDEMLRVIDEFCRANKLHGFSILWPDPEFASLVGPQRFQRWRHQHFRWVRGDARDFDEYLTLFNKNQRRNIRRERRSMEKQDLAIRPCRAADADDVTLSAMYRYYSNTNDQFGAWAARYLTEEFFMMLREACGESVLFFCAYENGSRIPVGMSMLLTGADALIVADLGVILTLPEWLSVATAEGGDGVELHISTGGTTFN